MKILVTTDFSENSKSAIHYALALAKVFSATVEVLNSYVNIPTIGIDGGINSLDEKVIESGRQNNLNKLKDYVSTINENEKKGIVINKNVVCGEPVTTICERSVEGNFDFIVMGTMGESKIEEILFGSTTVDVMKQASCPVLAIPPNAVYYGIKKIVYATDLEEDDIKVIKHLCDLAKFFDSDVVVFHSFPEDNMTAQEDADEFNKLLQKHVTYPKLSKESITYGNSHDAILEVIKKDLANLIVMREKRRGIFSRLFHPDMVKRINYHTSIPLLTYNEKSLK